jgi:hypothetical protein
VEFYVTQHVWLNIWAFKMPNGLAPHFIAKYASFMKFYISRISMCTP